MLNNVQTEHLWLADGIKAGVKGFQNDSLSSGFEYLCSLVYRRNAIDELSLESASFGGARIRVADIGDGLSYIPNYFLTDHLGSTRVVLTQGENGLDIVGWSDYYPYGSV